MNAPTSDEKFARTGSMLYTQCAPLCANPDGTRIVRDPDGYPPNISLGFGEPRKTKNGLIIFVHIRAPRVSTLLIE